MVLSVLPVNSSPNQTFEVSLPIDSQNRKFRFFFSWNPIGQYWQFDLYDINNNGVQLLSNMPVGPINYPYNNVLIRYVYKEIGSLYIINVSDVVYDRPHLNNLGTDWVLVWGDTPNV